MVRLPEFSIFGLVGIPINWRREKRAMDAGLALALQSLVVVTLAEVYVFDAWLLGFKGVRLLLRHGRDDLVAKPIRLAHPLPPAGASPELRRRATLRLEDGGGHALAELAPRGWGADVKSVFRVLTGSEGWPPQASEAPA